MEKISYKLIRSRRKTLGLEIRNQECTRALFLLA